FFFLLGISSSSSAEMARDLKPPAREQIDKSIQRGVSYLLKAQNKDGSWGSATLTKDLNILAPVPGSHQPFRAAVTALGISALLESGSAAPNPPAHVALD